MGHARAAIASARRHATCGRLDALTSGALLPLVTVGPLPSFIPPQHLLGAGAWEVREEPGGIFATATLPQADTADVTARLRGLGFAGLPTQVRITPPLKRTAVRAGRLREARARRDTSVGFSNPLAKLDDEGHRSLTPEPLALALADRAAGRCVLDLTAGAGGNTIAFARRGCRVIAVEVDAARLDDARYNATLYGVEAAVTWVHGDARLALPSHTGDLTFIDPPWGGYDKRYTALSDLPLLNDLLPLLPPSAETWIKLPPSFDVASLPGRWDVEAWFGVQTGDRHRVKFLLARRRVVVQEVQP
jgi:SAM-dependent methyltransferase